MNYSIFQRKIPDGVVLCVITAVVYIPFLFFIINFGYSQIQTGTNPEFVYPVYGSDSAGYVVLADNILQSGVFSGDAKAPFTPDTFRTPGYPLLLASYKLFFGSYTWFPIVQILLTLGAAFLIFRIGERLFSRRIGLVGAIAYLCDPTTILHTLVLLSDTPFVFFILLSVYLGFFYTPKAGSRISPYGTFFAAGAVLGFATLVRPIGMFLPIIFIPAYAFFHWKLLPPKKIALYLCAFILGWSLLVVPWTARNRAVVGVWGLSSVSSFNLFQYYVPEFLAYREHTTPDTIRLQMQHDLPAGMTPQNIGDLKYSKVVNAISIRYLLSGNILAYIPFHLVKTIPVFLSSGIKHIMFYYNDAIGYPAFQLSTANMTTLLLKGQFGAFFQELKISFWPTCESFVLLIVTMFAAVALFSKKHRGLTVFFWILILYFSLLTGSVAYARFRLPISPFLFLLAPVGATMLWRKLVSKNPVV